MTRPRAGRPGLAPLALLLILVITAAWWALALWPAGAAEPEWLVRTRAACFGSAPGGLPDLGGWILLVGQPLGMIGVLVAVWGEALLRDLALMRGHPGGRLALMGVPILLVAGLVGAGRLVAGALGLGASAPGPPAGVPVAVDLDISSLALLDQHQRRTPFGELSEGPFLLTVAFGHCGTICPTVVHDVLRARNRAAFRSIPLVVVTLDPWRDTPERLALLARQWQIGGDDLVLSGSVAEVEQVLDRLMVGRRRDPATGDIDHVGTVMVVDERGHVVSRLEGGWGQVDLLLAAVPVPVVTDGLSR